MFIKSDKALLFGVVCLLQSGFAISGMTYNTMYTSFPVENSEYVMQGELQVFNIKEGEYSPGSYVEYVAKKEMRYDTPENALIARFSTLSIMDLPLWKEQWESSFQAQESLNRLLLSGMTKEQVIRRWGDVTKYNYIHVVHRILYEEYAVVTYQVAKERELSNEKGIEIPIIFKQIGGEWKVSSGLSKSPLVSYSPWKTGKYSVIENRIWVAPK